MDNTAETLIGCFESVFPNLTRDQIRAADLGSIPEWDSIAAINLLAVIEEEFGVNIDPADLPNLVSFDRILEYLREKRASPAL
jgi:acyl carrier protein